MKNTTTKSRFSNVYQNMMKTRWYISIITMITMLLVFFGISMSVVFGFKIQQEIKELMMLLLGAFISSYNRVIDFWFNNSQRDDKLIEKMDQEDDTPEILKIKLDAPGKVVKTENEHTEITNDKKTTTEKT